MDIRRSLIRHYWLQLLLLIAIIGVANHMSSQHFVRLDLTKDQKHTLSQVTRNSLRRLNRPLQVRVYFTDNLQAPYNNHKQALLDKLGELQALSKGKISLEVFDPDESKARQEEAKELGIEAIPYRYQKGTLTEARTVYMGAVLMYGERQIPLGPLVSPETMEYELVRAIRVISGKPNQVKTVGYLVSEGEPDLDKVDPKNPLGQFRDRVREQHTLKPVSLGGADNPLEGIDALFVMGPQVPMGARAQYQLDQYLMTGKPASFFLSAFRPDFGSMRSIPIRHGLNGLLGHYGLQLNKDAIVDRKNNEQFNVPITTGNQTRRVPVNYPLIPTTTDINRNHLLGRRNHQMVLPFVSSITIDPDPNPGVNIDVLVSTSEDSGSIQSLRHIQPNVFKVPVPGEVKGPHVVAATVTGRLSSFYLNKEVPPPSGMAPDDPRFKSDPTQTVVDGASTRLLVVSSADFMANNLPFMLNVTDWMLDDANLMDIRSKLTAPAPMTHPEGRQALLYKIAIVGVPLLFLAVLGGLIWWMGRRRT